MYLSQATESNALEQYSMTSFVSGTWSCHLSFFLMRPVSTDWSTCQLSERAVCGYGIKTRMLDCVRSDSKSVDLRFCKEVGYVVFFLLKPLLKFFLSLERDQIHIINQCFQFQLGLEKKWQMNASCIVECPINCQLSDWSLWSECTHNCGLAGICMYHIC